MNQPLSLLGKIMGTVYSIEDNNLIRKCYQLGYNHRLMNYGLVLDKPVYDDPKLEEAYRNGYKEASIKLDNNLKEDHENFRSCRIA